MTDPKLRVLISAEQIQTRIKELGEKISADYPTGNLHMICILKGAVFFMTDLARAMKRDVQVDFMGISTYGKGKTSSGKRKGWTEEKRDEKLRSLARVVRHFEPLSFEFSINREIFYRDLKPVSPRGLGKPHFTGCFAVVAGLANFVASKNGNIPIEFIFDEQEGVDEDIALFFAHMKKSLPKKARELIASTPMFRNDKDKQFLPLQAADMLAWHLRREHATERLPMADLLRSSEAHLVSGVDEPTMKRWTNHHSQLPGISQLQSKAQWRAVKGEIARLSSLGIDASTIGRRKNIFQRVREGIARL